MTPEKTYTGKGGDNEEISPAKEFESLYGITSEPWLRMGSGSFPHFQQPDIPEGRVDLSTGRKTTVLFTPTMREMTPQPPELPLRPIYVPDAVPEIPLPNSSRIEFPGLSGWKPQSGELNIIETPGIFEIPFNDGNPFKIQLPGSLQQKVVYHA